MSEVEVSEIKVFFVLPKDCNDVSEVSTTMSQAYDACKRTVTMSQVSWVQETKIPSMSLKKTDYVVFDQFEGSAFEAAKNTKCAVVGPRAVLTCIEDDKRIPNYNWPIYNVAMYDCNVCCSHLTKSDKEQIKTRIELMGGCYTNSLVRANTHLVTSSVKSEKYSQAAEAELKVMLPQWIEAVWEVSQISKIHCDDENFSIYRCPPFHNLNLSCTGLTTVAEREILAEKIKQHGGTLNSNMALNSTDFLIVCGAAGSTSAKYKTARKKEIHCVTMSWVDDSITKGYALPHRKYQIEKATSTPTKTDQLYVPNFSILSAIGDATTRTSIDDTQFNEKSPVQVNKVKGIVDRLDINKAKKAGSYLDGCSVYLMGFSGEEREKLFKILNLSGATRYDVLSQRVTHIIVGDKNCPEVKLAKEQNSFAVMISIDWLVASMEKGEPAEEETFRIKITDEGKELFGSPLGKKGINLLRSHTMRSEEFEAVNIPPEEPPVQEEDLMEHYRKQLCQTRDNESDLLKSNTESELPETETSDVFCNKCFFVTIKDVSQRINIINAIENGGGIILNDPVHSCYFVTSEFIEEDIKITDSQIIINHFWIAECFDGSELVPILYYHKPLVIKRHDVLKNCVITVSSYLSYERIFLQNLIVELGGTCQEKFARIDSNEKGVRASTHLVSMEANGKKYDAALKWGLPVVGKNWLLECTKKGEFVTEEQFLLGGSKVGKTQTSVRPTPKKNEEPIKVVSVETAVNKLLTSVKNQETTPVRKGAATSKESSPESPMIDLDAMLAEARKAGLLRPRPDSLDLMEPASQTTPVSNKRASPKTPATPTASTPNASSMLDGSYIETPDRNGLNESFFNKINPNMSQHDKNEIKKYFNRIPEFVPPSSPPPKVRRLSTPLSEVKRRVWEKLLATPPRWRAIEDGVPSGQMDNQENTPRVETQNTDVIANNFKQLEEMVINVGSSKKGAQSKSYTRAESEFCEGMPMSPPRAIGWDGNIDDEVFNAPPKKMYFIISGMDYSTREKLTKQIKELGGEIVSDSEYDPKCTHLVCERPGRSEKVFACMASGKWILHYSYIEKCAENGGFTDIDEEEYEFGNPRSWKHIPESMNKDSRYKAIYLCRKEVCETGKKPFENMKFIIVGRKRDLFVRIVQAGGGIVLDLSPPFKMDVEVNYCLLEDKNINYSDYFPLAKRGIPCLNVTFIDGSLHKSDKQTRDFILPAFARFYSQ